MRHVRLVTVLAKRRLKTEWHAARLAGTLNRLVTQAAADALPADAPLHPLAGFRLADHAAAVARRLQHALRSQLAHGLADLAGLTHAQTARTLTARVRGRLPVRPVKREAWTDYLADYDTWVIDPPTPDLIARLVGPAPDYLTRLIDPQRAARAVYDGIAAGHDRRRIAADLEELFGGYATSAKRVARTWGIKVATDTQLAASEQIPDLVRGYQILAVLDLNTRPEHYKRSGTVYLRNPGPGQLGMDVMPRPPMDWTPAGWKMAWNCRCVPAPVFGHETPDELAAAGALVFGRQTGHVR